MDLAALASHPLVGLLALVGGVGLVYRLGRSLLRLGLSAAEKTAVDGLVEVSMRNGDLTGMAERQAQADAARRARARAGLLAGLWAALLVVPPIAGIASLVYAPAALVWLLPRKPLRLPTHLPSATQPPQRD